MYTSDMAKRQKKKRADLNELAKSIVDHITDEGLRDKVIEEGKNPAAVMLGRLGGLKGGKARAQSLSAERRREIAKKAATARWKDQ